MLAPLIQPAVDKAMQKGGEGLQNLGENQVEAGQRRRAQGGFWNKLLGTAQEWAGELIGVGGVVLTGGVVVKRRQDRKKAKQGMREMVRRDQELVQARTEGAKLAFAKKPEDLLKA